jgi:branched-chain amino acid transport system permease protein
MIVFIRKNYLRILVLAVLAGLFAAAANGMESKDFVITLLRGLSVGSLTFLVASGFSLIFGLLDVLNLAHGTLFMIGAYVGWTVYVRPDTFVDLLTPIALILSGFLLGDVWTALLSSPQGATRSLFQSRMKRILPWAGLLVSALILFSVLRNYPIGFWSLEDYAISPVSIAYNAGQGINVIPPPARFEAMSPWLAFIGLIAGSLLLAFSLSLFGGAKSIASPITWRSFIGLGIAVLAGILFFIFNDSLTNALAGLNSNWLFLVAVIVAVTSGVTLGTLMEATLIRPLYIRPIYQLMLTLGLSAIGIEIVRAIWGRPEFTMPRPELFAAVGGEGCPAISLADWWQYHCSTMIVLEGRIRIYNEIFIPIIGLVVLVGVWILLQRSRLGMIIRAGVQDREMVEALGINVRRVFTQVFALGVGLAALGGVLAAPSIGLSNSMGDSFLLNALFALAIGGLTSYPGAALGSLLVGLLQQFIIKYGQIGIAIPFTEIVFKPTPPIVPASTILLMVVILLILPNGLLGKKE